jgi:hypothetical protein
MEQEIADEVLEAYQKAFHFKVDLMKYVADYEDAKNTVQNHNVEPLLFEKMGRPYLFHPSNYANLIKRLEKVIDVIGYKPVMVASMVE